MATIQIGNVTGAIYQAARPIRLNPDGSGQGTLTYKCAAGSSVAVIPAYLTPHPFLPALKCYESEIDQENGGVIVITSIYKGVIAENPETLAQLDFNKTTTEAPVETHPRFALPRNAPPVTPQNIAAIELALQNNQDLPAGQGAAAELLYGLKRRGIESYLKPGCSYKRSYVSESIPSGALLNDIGKIKSPPSPAPSAPTDQNYLFTGASWSKQAGVVTITEEYLLSGPGGWDPNLYESA